MAWKHFGGTGGNKILNDENKNMAIKAKRIFKKVFHFSRFCFSTCAPRSDMSSTGANFYNGRTIGYTHKVILRGSFTPVKVKKKHISNACHGERF